MLSDSKLRQAFTDAGVDPKAFHSGMSNPSRMSKGMMLACLAFAIEGNMVASKACETLMLYADAAQDFFDTRPIAFRDSSGLAWRAKA